VPIRILGHTPRIGSNNRDTTLPGTLCGNRAAFFAPNVAGKSFWGMLWRLIGSKSVLEQAGCGN